MHTNRGVRIWFQVTVAVAATLMLTAPSPPGGKTRNRLQAVQEAADRYAQHERQSPIEMAKRLGELKGGQAVDPVTLSRLFRNGAIDEDMKKEWLGAAATLPPTSEFVPEAPTLISLQRAPLSLRKRAERSATEKRLHAPPPRHFSSRFSSTEFFIVAAIDKSLQEPRNRRAAFITYHALCDVQTDARRAAYKAIQEPSAKALNQAEEVVTDNHDYFSTYDVAYAAYETQMAEKRATTKSGYEAAYKAAYGIIYRIEYARAYRLEELRQNRIRRNATLLHIAEVALSHAERLEEIRTPEVVKFTMGRDSKFVNAVFEMRTIRKRTREALAQREKQLSDTQEPLKRTDEVFQHLESDDIVETFRTIAERYLELIDTHPEVRTLLEPGVEELLRSFVTNEVDLRGALEVEFYNERLLVTSKRPSVTIWR